jgi:hypothetical protein
MGKVLFCSKKWRVWRISPLSVGNRNVPQNALTIKALLALKKAGLVSLRKNTEKNEKYIFLLIFTCGLYYKHMMIITDNSSATSK